MITAEINQKAEDLRPTCPLCHTASTTMTPQELSNGAYWRCARCGQMWDAARLTTAAAYAHFSLSSATSLVRAQDAARLLANA